MINPSSTPLPVVRSLSRLGQAISLARRRRRLTQQELADRIGATANTVRRMENGHPGTAIMHIARALQVFGELGQLNQLLDTPQDTVGLNLELFDGIPKAQVNLVCGMNIALIKITLVLDGAMAYE